MNMRSIDTWMLNAWMQAGMLQPHQSSQRVLRSTLTRHEDQKARNDTSVFYIGLGDQFDDDRRLVREASARVPPGDTSQLGWRLP
jgi:hypothetical protein